MSRKPAAKPVDPLWGWRELNPMYRTSRPRTVVINGIECVEIDGGKSSEMASFGRTTFFTTSKRGR